MALAKQSKRAVTSKLRGRAHRVVMLCYPDAHILDIAGPLEVFGFTARWLRRKGIVRNLAYSVELVGLEAGPFTTTSGIRLVAKSSYRDIRGADTLLISGGLGYYSVMKDEGVLRWIRRLAPRVARIGSVCTGALILASTGLLDGKSATTHWDGTDDLSRLSASIKVQRDAIYVRDGNIYTSAGFTAGMDMALAMVEEDWGQPVALAVAQALVMFLKRPGSQSQFSAQLAAQFSEDNKLRELQLWMLDHLDQDLSVPKIATRVVMSERNFARRFTKTVGMTPGQYVSMIRLEAARRKLEENELQISQVARRCGFGTQESMRRTFIAKLGIPPSEYRKRFRSTRKS